MNDGLQIFPVHKVFDSERNKWRKHPAVPKGQDWHSYKATPEQIAHASNVGVVIPEGRVVIDLDTYKGVTTEIVETVLGCSLDWEGAAIQETVSKGKHYCFELPDGMSVVQGDSLLGVSGFDTRCAGRGWICTGDGYTDLTLFGMPGALHDETFPMLPAEAIEKLNAGGISSDDPLADLEQAISSQPLDGVTVEDVRRYVMMLPDTDLETYSPWVKAGMAIHHQLGGSDEGLQIWIEWSQRSTHFDESECRQKWPTFAKRNNIGKPTRFDYVIHRVGGKAVMVASLAEEWAAKASEVVDIKAYEAFKRDVRKVPLALLPQDERAMIAQALFDSFGKGKGISRSDIKKGIMPPKKSDRTIQQIERPDWVSPWVYVETTCEFANTELNYAIKREAFNAKYDRLPEVVISEKNASTFALNDCQIPTVVDNIFWPGADRIVEHASKDMLNTYYADGCEPCDTLDDQGREVVQRFVDHVAFTIEDKREQAILLDFLTFCYQNPGRRVNWALLLQGAQGTGKSYFASVLQAIMGNLVSNLDPTAIAGRFTGWAHGSIVVVVEEVRISGTNRYEVLDRIKPFITNPTIQIEEKGRDHRTVPNFTSYLLLTNHKDALPLAEGDRRYCVMFGRVQSEQQLYKELGGEQGASDYFTQLFDDVSERPDALAHFFTHRKLTEGFNPKGRAPETRARQMMMGFAASPDRMMVEDMLAKHECGAINSNVVDVTWLNDLCVVEGDELPKTRTLGVILIEMGYEQIEGRRMRINKTGKQHYVWVKGGCCTSEEAKQEVKGFHDDPSYVYLPF